MDSIFNGAAYVLGTASGMLMTSKVELSVWGGVDPRTGKVIDRYHPLCGQSLENKILAIPGGRGSCSGSGVILELLLNGRGPKAMIFERCEEILTLGVMVAEELFEKSIPAVVLAPEDFRIITALNGKMVYINNGHVIVRELDSLSEISDTPQPSKGKNILDGIRLCDSDKAYLNGTHGEASRVAMRIVLRMAKLMGAHELMTVTQVHIDGCHYTGPGSLAFAKKLRDWGGRVRVPTTLNAISVDKRRWRALGIDTGFGESSTALADAYTDMGARPTFTCAPYQLDTAPIKGDQIAWAESNAVVYANSVLGARTMKYPDFLDIAIALTGRAPNAGVHIASNRLASLHVRISKSIKSVDDSFYPLLGYAVGSLAVTRIPVVSGIEVFNPSKDDLRAFGAAFATVSSAPMFHVVGVTPEAPSLSAAVADGDDVQVIDLDRNSLEVCWNRFNQTGDQQKVDLVSLGNPHFSFAEMRKLSHLCSSRTKYEDISVIVTCSRSVHGMATQAGLVEVLENFGVQFMTDTCWCMIGEPIIPHRAAVIMTNSGKYAHYGPGITGRQFCFGNLEMCIETACRGIWRSQKPPWLNTTQDM